MTFTLHHPFLKWHRLTLFHLWSCWSCFEANILLICMMQLMPLRAYPVGLISIQYFMMLVGRGHSDVDYFLDSSFHSVFPPTYPGLCHISVELWEPLVWSGRGGSRWKPWGPYFENGEITFLFQLYRKS